MKRIKGHIYGSKKKGGFQKSIPFQYYKLLEKYEFSQRRFFNRSFSLVCDELKTIKGIGRTVSFDIASGAFVTSPEEIVRLEPDRIYLKDSTGPLKGFTMLLADVRETSWAKAKMIVSNEMEVDTIDAEETIVEFEKYLVDQAFGRLSQVNPNMKRFEALLEVEDLICNYKKSLRGDARAREDKYQGLFRADEKQLLQVTKRASKKSKDGGPSRIRTGDYRDVNAVS